MVNAVIKSNLLTNGNLINEQKIPWTDLKVQLLFKNERLLTGPVRYVNLTNLKQTDGKKV